MPTDTMLILDVSGSMNDDEGTMTLPKKWLTPQTIASQIFFANKYSRIGVVLYSGVLRSVN